MTQKRFFFLVSGCIGIVLLILPTVPFFLLAVFCFANSSQKLHDWFIGTKMYRKHLEFFVQRKDMTRKAKASIPTSVTCLMGWGSSSWHGRPFEFPCGILVAVWLCRLIYFLFGLKTLTEETGKEADPA